jgi:hypothetical protein
MLNPNRRVKGAERMPGVSEILLPGERGDRMSRARLDAGVMPIEPNMLARWGVSHQGLGWLGGVRFKGRGWTGASCPFSPTCLRGGAC